MKTCYSCKKIKPLTEYWKKKRNSDGYNNYCKDCERARMKIYRANNKDKILAEKARYRDRRKKKILAQENSKTLSSKKEIDVDPLDIMIMKKSVNPLLSKNKVFLAIKTLGELYEKHDVYKHFDLKDWTNIINYIKKSK